MVRQRINTSAAFAALIVFVVGELLFRYSTLNNSFPLFASIRFVDVFDAVSMGIAVVAILSRPDKMPFYQIVLAGTGVTVLFISALWANDYRLLYCYVLLIAVSNQDLKKLCGTYGFLILLITTSLIIMSTAGILQNRDVIPNLRMVFSYGFSHPNTTASMLMAGILPLAYFCWDLRSWWIPSVLACLCSIFSYTLLSSHAGAALLFMMAALFVIGHTPHLRQLEHLPKKAFVGVLIIIPLSLLLIMLFFTVFYNTENPVFALVDKLLHGRPSHAHEYYIENGGFTVLGSPNATQSRYHTGLPFAGVDSGYCRLALINGLLPLCVLVVTYIASLQKLSKTSGNYLVFVAFLLASFHMLVEHAQLYVAEGFAILFLASAFSGEANKPLVSDVVFANERQSLRSLKGFAMTYGRRIFKHSDGLLSIEKFNKKWIVSDIVLLSISILMIVSFACGALYFKQYAIIDKSVSPGEMTIADEKGPWAILEIHDDGFAEIRYANHTFKGNLSFAGAEEDTILFQLTNIVVADKPFEDEAVLFLRIPREGLQGDFSGVWMIYYSCPALREKQSMWILAKSDGMASVGTWYGSNALNEPRFKLIERSESYKWQQNGSRLVMTYFPTISNLDELNSLFIEALTKLVVAHSSKAFM